MPRNRQEVPSRFEFRARLETHKVEDGSLLVKHRCFYEGAPLSRPIIEVLRPAAFSGKRVVYQVPGVMRDFTSVEDAAYTLAGRDGAFNA